MTTPAGTKAPRTKRSDAYVARATISIPLDMAAIAASLNALRAIERHGGAQILERAFAGFTALANPDSFDPWEALGLKPGASREAIDAAFRHKSKECHPDAPGGSTEAFQRIERARRMVLS